MINPPTCIRPPSLPDLQPTTGPIPELLLVPPQFTIELNPTGSLSTQALIRHLHFSNSWITLNLIKPVAPLLIQTEPNLPHTTEPDSTQPKPIVITLSLASIF
ncbi:hypothetical protein KFK09_026527 [Dendrobium nobile]|uniref:Uncharacterized protein n=1 Tax=Dendrobium nobile TaxID=94219 RepID=A0A8T3A812_DENNO|nr:hypothetical protein KFK09_026527 [Dendrobium nobile]